MYIYVQLIDLIICSTYDSSHNNFMIFYFIYYFMYINHLNIKKTKLKNNNNLILIGIMVEKKSVTYLELQNRILTSIRVRVIF